MSSSKILQKTMQRIYDVNLTTMSGGNLSIRDDQGIWVTPKGIDKSSLSTDDMMFEDINGKIHGKNTVTSEFYVHKAILDVNPRRSSVLHSHPASILGMSAIQRVPNSRLLRMSFDRFGDRACLAKYADPGTGELAQETSNSLKFPNNVAILENHGLFVSAVTQSEAFDILQSIDLVAKIEMMCSFLDQEINGLSQADVDKIENYTYGSFEENTFKLSEAMTEKAKLIVTIMKRLYQRGITTSRSGTVSLRVDEHSFLISPESIDIEELRWEDIVYVSSNKHEKGKAPSKYLALHKKIYDNNPKINSAISASPKYMMTYGVSNLDFISEVIPECYKLIGKIRKYPFDCSDEFYDRVAQEFDVFHQTMLINNDVFVATGKDILKTYDRMEVAEATAEGLLSVQKLGEVVRIREESLKKFDKIVIENNK